MSAVPACRTADVLALAEAAYQERALPAGHLDAARLAVLADALEEAGAAAELVRPDHGWQPRPPGRDSLRFLEKSRGGQVTGRGGGLGASPPGPGAPGEPSASPGR